MSEKNSLVNDLHKLVIERRFDVLLLMSAAMLPLWRNFTSFIIVAVFVIVCFIIRLKWRPPIPENLRVNWKYLLVTAGFYLWMIFSLIYSSDVSSGVNFLVSNSYLLFYPIGILLLMQDLTSTHFRLISITFIGACLVDSALVNFHFYETGLFSSFKSAEYNDLPFRTALMSKGDHPTYVSMWYLFSCLLVLHRLLDRKSSLGMKMLNALVVLVLGGTTLLLSARVAIVAFFVAFLTLLYLFVKRKRVLLAVYTLSMTIFFVSVMQVSFLRARFIDEFNVTQLKPPVGLATTSLNLRVGIYLCSWKVFINNILIGVGIGDSQRELNSCYNQYDTNAYREGSYNTHNNYLAIAVSGGIIGLGLFLLNMGFHLNRSAALNNRLFSVFLVFFMILLTGENILSRNHGVVFYSLFCAILARQNLQNESKP